MNQQFWDDSYREDPEHTVVPDHVLAAELANLTPGRALDLGCGTGPNALMLAEMGWSVLGVDWSQSAVELATESAMQRSLDASFIVADTTTWQPSEQFDLVISTYALPGGEDSSRILHTAVAAMKPGGTLIVVEWDASMAEVWGLDANELLTPELIVAMLPGLKIEKTEVRHVPDMFAGADDPRGSGGPAANVTLVRASRPSDEQEMS